MIQTETYQEEKIKEILSEMGSLFFDIQYRNQILDFREDKNFEFEYETSVLENNFCDLAKRVFKLTLVYLEAKRLDTYFKRFLKDSEYYLANNINMLNAELHEESGDYFSKFTSFIFGYLSVFPAFGNSDDIILKRVGLIYLENILLSTANILKTNNIIPVREADISKNVRFVTEATFSDAKFPSEPFVKTAKTYKPDVLVPSLHCAVEYKLIDCEAKLKTTIDEILIDVEGYSKNPIYRIFYAVFYISPGICSLNRFLTIWDEKNFPQNWKSIYVIGQIKDLKET